MHELTKINNSIGLPKNKLARVRATHPTITAAYETPKIGSLSSDEIGKQLTSILGECFQALGQKVAAADLAAISMQVEQELIKFPQMHIGEIRFACRKGVHGEYPEKENTVTVNFVRVRHWLKCYRSSQERAEFINELNKEKEMGNKPTEEEIFNMALTNVSNALKSFQNTGVVGLVGSVVYDFLSALKLIEYSTEEKREIFDQAKEEVLKEAMEAKATNLDRLKRLEMGRLIDSLNGGGEDKIIIARAKRICVEEFFRSMDMEGVDVLDLIKSKKAA